MTAAFYVAPCACVGMSAFHEPGCRYFDSAHDPAGLANAPDEPTFSDDDPDAPHWRGELGFPWDEYDLRPDVDGPDWSDE